MPAYGNALNPSETKALMRFLMTLNGSLTPAVDASRELAQPAQPQPAPAAPTLAPKTQ